MELKELETKIQKIFNNNNLIVRDNYASFRNGVIVYLPDDYDDIHILSSELYDGEVKMYDKYHLKFYPCDSIEYLNKIQQALEVAKLWKNDFIQKQVIELIREYSIQFDNIDTGRLINGAELCQEKK